MSLYISSLQFLIQRLFISQIGNIRIPISIIDLINKYCRINTCTSQNIIINIPKLSFFKKKMVIINLFFVAACNILIYCLMQLHCIRIFLCQQKSISTKHTISQHGHGCTKKAIYGETRK